MQAINLKNPSDRNKLILAIVLGLIALLFVWWTFVGFGGGSSKVTPRPATQPTAQSPRTTTVRPSSQTAVDLSPDDLSTLRVIPTNFSPVGAQEARRNIFVYYEPPVKVVQTPTPPTPTPTPVPPILLTRISPPNVYARTGDFTLEVDGDKFTPALRVVVENTEVPTRYVSPQQLSAAVPASLITSPGARQVMLRSADGKLYSNTMSLSVADPPKPNYTYIGIYGTQKHIHETAVLLDKSNKDTLNVQLGDLVGGRFRITSISEKEVVLIDTNLKIKHNLIMTVQGDRSNPLQRPTPRVESEDDEP
ncbi:MAG TPA: hypothetical protein VLL54_21160 [Pyrinomonadaceae bacterium]|nr:hypothetical protein [Pyrinomonadaceae bacterium]